jgi:ADP-heptose:LPS heptosyltransferase
VNGFLAIAERGLGDGLTLLPSLRALRAAHPEIRVELLASGLFPLAENLRDTAIALDPRPLTGLGDEERLAWLRARNLRWVWNTESEPSRWAPVLRRSGHQGWVSAPGQRTWGQRHVIQVRFEQLRELFPELRAPGELKLSLTPSQQAASRAFRAEFASGNVLVAIQPGAGDPRRIWPAGKFRALAARLAELPRVTVLVFQAELEGLHGASQQDHRPNMRYLSEPLKSVLPKLAACDLYIGNDSGFYHLAYALGLKVVGIYRSLRSARRWSHRSRRSRAVLCWMPRQLDRDWTRWVSVQRVLRHARKLAPGL